MDLFLALADSLGVDVPHLPLKEGMMTMDVFTLINMLYLDGNPQNPDEYASGQVFYNRDGRLQFEVRDKEGNVLINFINKSMTPVATAVEVVDTSKLLADPLKLEEPFTDLLDGLVTGMRYPVDRPTHDDFPFTLAKFLNDVGYVGGWTSGTFGQLCTGGLEVIYKGPGDGAPDGFPKLDSPLMAILEFHHGIQKGYICLAT